MRSTNTIEAGGTSDRASTGFRSFLNPFSRIGLFLAVLCFAASLTPSMIPRPTIMQGLLAGIAAILGYSVGAAVQALWCYMELPRLRGQALRITTLVLGVFCLGYAAFCLWNTAAWQNSIRARMSMDLLGNGHVWVVCAVALVSFLVLFAVGRSVLILARVLIERARRRLPRRVANVLGFSAAFIVVWLVASGVLGRGLLPVLDASFRRYDALLQPEFPMPTRADRSGSKESLLTWQSLGRAGREFVGSGPSAAQIQAVSGKPAMEPIRTYVGLQGAETPEERARLALAELKRAGGFDRSVVVIVTPTGTGWIDPAALTALEYLHHGDVASVAVQYSYLNSPLSLTVHPEYGSEAARALFTEVYNYWTSLPRDQRPRLYLHGLSLGAMNSARSFDLFDIVGDPVDGAVWSGPPFASLTWQRVTKGRNPGSPEWRPIIGDSRLFRFMNQDGSPVPADTPWGPMRIVYLQYASDAITFFNPHDFYRSPDWMQPPRGPDVSPELSWYPVVSFVQFAFDMFLSMETPLGYGHVYAPQHYINAWEAVAGAPGWSAEEITRLKAYLDEEARREIADEDRPGNPYGDRGG